MKKLLIAAIAALSVAAAGAKGPKFESVKGDPMNSRIYTLPNGLKVYMAVNHEEPRIQTYIAVKVGGKNDPAETTGLAHYFEHLMFKGTPNFGTQNFAAEKPLLDEIERLFEIYRVTTDGDKRAELYKRIDSISYIASGYSIPNEYDKLMSVIGATGTNAYTGYDQTVYVEDIPANQIDSWARIQSDRFRNATIRGFHTELETVYEEKNMSLTRDSRKVVEQMLAALFPRHPYGSQTVLGTQEHLKNPSITNIKNYHKQWYVPNNMAVCVSGDFDPDQMLATITKYFGDMKPNKNLPKLNFAAQPAITSPIVKEVLGLEAENVTVAWRTGGAASKDNDMMSILSSILYNGKAGIFDLELNKKQLTLSSYAGYTGLSDHGVLMLQGRPKADQTLDQVRDLMMEQIAKLRRGEFDESLLTSAINNFKAGQMRYLDSNNGRADMFVSAFINGVAWKDAVEELDRIARITKADVVKFANERFSDQNYIIIYKRQGKDPNELKMEKPALTPIKTNRDAQSALLKEIAAVEVAPIEPVWVDFSKDMAIARTNSNLEVLYKKNESTDIFTLQYVLETGNNNDKSVSMASQYIQLLGTADMSAAEFAAEFYKIACSWYVSVAEDRTYVTITGLSENMPRAMQLVEKLLAGAVPNEGALAALKARNAKARADAKLNQMSIFSRLRTYMMRGPEFIAATTLSDAELEALTSEDLLSKLRSINSTQHSVIYYGPRSGSEVLAYLDAHHPVAKELKPAADKVKFPYVATPSSSVMLAEYDAAQIYYSQYSNRGERFDPTLYPAMRLYNGYFGGAMNSIVFQEMREARGLAYSSQAVMVEPSRLENPYVYQAFIATQNDKLKDAASAFDEIINRMPESQAAFNVAKQSILAELRTERIIKSGVLSYYLRLKDLGISTDRRQKLWETIPGMTLDDVRKYQQNWVAGRPYTFGILGRSAELDAEFLKTLGPVKKISLTELFGY